VFLNAVVEIAERNGEMELLCIALSNIAVGYTRAYQYKDAETKARNAIEIAKTLFQLSSRKVNYILFLQTIII
jgi:hypothetical protein